jgi:hypothetical protein
MPSMALLAEASQARDAKHSIGVTAQAPLQTTNEHPRLMCSGSSP